ncbi:MAG: hypothetical protein ACFFCX_13830 [Candidatus Sifarchaeia archaeon]
MHDRLYRLFGKILAFIGMMLILVPLVTGIYIFADANNPLRPPTMVFSSEGIPIMVGIISFGFMVTYLGMLIHKDHRTEKPFFIKDGGPIHSGEPWTKSSEIGLFLTNCGLVISINQESNATSHSGYRTITAERVTCSDCVHREGRFVLDRALHARREY